MRGEHRQQETMFSYVAPEARVPERLPLRPIPAMVDQALSALHAEFEALYSHTIAPRFRQSTFCVPRCCRSCIRCGRSACWSSRSTTICGCAGSSGCR